MMKKVKSRIMKLFSPKQDEYSQLKSQLRRLEEKLQNLESRKQLNSDRLSELHRTFDDIVEEKNKLPPQTQKKLQERIVKFQEQYKIYNFGKSMERSKPNSILNQDNHKNSKMYTANYNLGLSSSPINTEQTFQTSYYGKWEKPDSEHVLFKKETNRTPDSKSATQKEVSEFNDVEMKDLSDRNKEDIVNQNVDTKKEYKNGSFQSGRSTHQQKQTDENLGNFCYPVENFQQDQHTQHKEASFYETYKKDQQTQTTSRTNPALEDKFQNYNIKSEVILDSYVEHKTAADMGNDHKQDRSFSSRRSPVQQKQAQVETFMSSNQELGYNECGTHSRSFQQHEDKCYRESHFDAPQQDWRSLESANSRTVLQSCEIETPKTGAGHYVRSSRNQYHLGFDPNSKDIFSHRSSTEYVQIPIEEENKHDNRQKQEKLDKSITEKNQRPTEQVSRRFIHEYSPKPNNGVVVLTKDGVTTIITQEKEGNNQNVVGRNHQHQYKQCTRQKQEEKVQFDQGKNFRKLGDETTEQSFKNKDRTSKNVRLLSQQSEDLQTQEVRNYQHQDKQFIQHKQEENVQFDQGKDLRKFGDENTGQDRTSKNVEPRSQQDNLQIRQVRGRGKLTSHQTVPQSDVKASTRNYHDQTVSLVDERRSCQQCRKSPGIAKPVHKSQTNFQESYNRTTKEIEVATEAVEEEPLQIIDAHKLFQDNFDLKSLNAMDATTQIETVKKWAGTFEEKVSNFSEAKFSLEYFVLDEKLMRFIEHLDKLKCREDPVATQKKIEAIEYIKSLQNTLDSRATDQ